MGVRDGATQGVVQHMIYDDSSNHRNRFLYNCSLDQILVLSNHNKDLHFSRLHSRPTDAANAANVEAPSSRHHQIWLENNDNAKQTEKERDAHEMFD